jgi:hypothetical protein
MVKEWIVDDNMYRTSNQRLASDSNAFDSRYVDNDPMGFLLELIARIPEQSVSGIRVLALETTTHDSRIRKALVNQSSGLAGKQRI